MDCSAPGFPVHHQLPEIAQTLVHWVSDAIQPSHPDVKNWLIWKDPDTGKVWRQEEKGMTEDEMLKSGHLKSAHFELSIWKRTKTFGDKV